jgi:hypothetical protein
VSAPQQSPEDLAASDDTYMATIAALDRAQKDFEAQYDADLSTYTLDYGNALKNLGYTEGTGKEGTGGKWALDDVGTASGRSYQNNLNDFAARGMLQSSGAFDSETQLLESLLDQYLATRRSKDKYTGDLTRTKAEFGNQDKLARQTALSEASARAAAGLAL